MIAVNRKIGTVTPRFNVSFYKNAYQQYKQGVYRDLIGMMEKSEIDSYVAGCLLGRRAGVMKDWNIKGWDESKQAEDRAALLTSALQKLNTRNLFRSILDAKMKKFSVIDFDWDIVDGLQFPRRFTKLHQKYFRYDSNDDYKLKIDFGNRLLEIPEEALVCQTDEHPILLPVLRDYILKDFGLEAWADFIELFGHPIILGKYPPGSDAEFKTELDIAVKAIARASQGTMPDTADIDIRETGRDTGDHEKFTEAANKGIAISILGHANAVEESSGMKVGQNETGFKVKLDIAVDDLYFIDEQIQKFLNLVQLRNFGDNKYCIFTTNKEAPPNVEELRENIDVAYNHGVALHISNYKKLGLAVSDDDEYIQKQDLDMGL